MNKRVLRLPVKKMYFEQIKEGTKFFEFRLRNEYWFKRLVNKTFDEVHILLGYPKRGDMSRTLVKPWLGFESKTITHEHFGPMPVNVYAIKIN